MSREIMQQALDALEYHTMQTRPISHTDKAIEALRQALAQPEFDTPESHIVKWSIPVDPNNFGEPLAQPEPQVCCGDYAKCMKACTPRGRWLVEKELAKPEQEPVCDKDPFYCWSIRCQVGKVCKHTAPPRKPWVGLTDDEIEKIVDLNTSDDGGFDIWCDGIAVAHIVCAKLKEKNT